MLGTVAESSLHQADHPKDPPDAGPRGFPGGGGGGGGAI